MLYTLQHSGLVGLVILLIAVTCTVLIAKASLRAKAGNFKTLGDSRKALLFWGVLAVLLGFIGHTMGLFTALSVVVDEESVVGADVAAALRQSLSPVIMGLFVLGLAGAGWFGLGLAERQSWKD